MTRVLFCTSEVHPFSKTGGLADLAGSLPRALTDESTDIRIVTPGYRSVLERYARECRVVARFRVFDEDVRILETSLPGSKVPVYIVEVASAFDRDGGLYTGPDNEDWPDNSFRFSVFCRVIVAMAMGRASLSWRPDIVHCNDWQTGLVPAFLTQESNRPATLFAIHNLAYQGLFSYKEFARLKLPEEFWSYESLEFNGHFSFIKGGLVYGDYLVTVSPSYAEEIQTPEFGHGLDGLLRHRSDRLVGILNGIDDEEWNPANDPALASCYDADTPELKRPNKFALQKELGLVPLPTGIVLSHIGRLTRQKGAELILASLPAIMTNEQVQVVILGTGDPQLERQLGNIARNWPGRMSVCAEFSEPLAHRIEAASDIFLMPSLYEPCGLNQMYSMRYGTIPVVRRTGGLRDTVICLAHAVAANSPPTGFCFEKASSESLTRGVQEAIDVYNEEPEMWAQMMKAGMTRDFSWRRSALSYQAVYGQLHPRESEGSVVRRVPRAKAQS